ncbi:MAG: hypothetical protein HOC43_05275 [Planctomycetes bacterium]|jgi:DNA mismatch repair protein MutH|nr:hypothetical protein [Planctomycetota bacterium]
MLNTDRYWNFESLIKQSKAIEGKWVESLASREIPPYDAQKQKSFFGLLIEECLGIAPNTRAEPDISDLGIEIKVSGFKQLSGEGGLNAKERLVFGLIDYLDVAKSERLVDLKIWNKIKRQLIFIYEYKKSMNVRFVHSFLWEPSGQEVAILEADYAILRTAVIEGEHLSGKGFSALDNFPKHPGKHYSKYRSAGRQGLVPPSSEVSQHPVLHDAEKRGLGIKNRFFTKVVAEQIGAPMLKSGSSVWIDRRDFFRHLPE